MKWLKVLFLPTSPGKKLILLLFQLDVLVLLRAMKLSHVTSDLSVVINWHLHVASQPQGAPSRNVGKMISYQVKLSKKELPSLPTITWYLQFTCSYKSTRVLSGSLSDCMACSTVSQWPWFISATNPSMLSTVFRVTPVSSWMCVEPHTYVSSRLSLTWIGH